MIQLIYICSATKWPTTEELLDILNTARERNHSNDITGLLIYGNATFIQVLEGPEDKVLETYNRIQKDNRVTGFVTLKQNNITDREFSDWSMAFKNLTDYDPATIPGYKTFFDGEYIQANNEQNKDSLKLLLKFTTNMI